MTSGLYRLYIEKEGKEYSYIGLSKNCEQRIKIHLQNIRSFYGLANLEKNVLLQLLKQGALGRFKLQAKDALYWKISFFCHLYDKEPKDFKWEILEEFEVDQNQDQEKQMEYIKKFNSERLGFNGPYHKQIQALASERFSQDPELRKYHQELAKKQEKINEQTVADMKNCKTEEEYEEKFMVWLGSQMGVEKYHPLFIYYCYLVIGIIEVKLMREYMIKEQKLENKE